MLITNLEDAWDGGYPSNVQLDNEEIVTEYYCGPNQKHQRYHMGVAIWNWHDHTNTRNKCAS